MDREKLLSPAIDWQHATIAERIDACGSMLFVHGYIPMSTREGITKKLTKELQPDIGRDRI